MNTIYDIISDPTRRQILDLIREQPRQVGELVDALNISQPGVSKQLKILRDAGLVTVQKDAQRRIYHLQPQPLIEIDDWLAAYRTLWEERFNRLDALLDDLQADNKTTD